ncbi:hypothetical protein V8C86DRAFT_2441131 [Haematococcus lacustris]
MRVATGEVDWWPEAFPRRAAFAAVGLGNSRIHLRCLAVVRISIKPTAAQGSSKQSAARESALENTTPAPPSLPPSLHGKTLEQQPPPTSLPPELDDQHPDQQPQQPPPTFIAHK